MINRLWNIEQKTYWLARYKPTGKTLFALTKSQLMSKINAFEKTQSIF